MSFSKTIKDHPIYSSTRLDHMGMIRLSKSGQRMDRRVVLSCADFRLKCIIYICAWNTQSLPTHTTTSHIFILPEFFSDTCEENSEMPGSYSVKSDAKSVGGGSDFSIANLSESSRPTCPESCSSSRTHKAKGLSKPKGKISKSGRAAPTTNYLSGCYADQ